VLNDKLYIIGGVHEVKREGSESDHEDELDDDGMAKKHVKSDALSSGEKKF
jgi:hypothetical protein